MRKPSPCTSSLRSVASGLHEFKRPHSTNTPKKIPRTSLGGRNLAARDELCCAVGAEETYPDLLLEEIKV